MVEYPRNFPVGEGGLSITRLTFMIVAPNEQAAADELRNYGKRLDDFPSLSVVVTTTDAELTEFSAPAGSPWCAVSGASEAVKDAMERMHGRGVTVSHAVTLVNDQYAVDPKRLMGAPQS